MPQPGPVHGDLLNNDGPGLANYDDNSIHIFNACGVDETAILDGFTITAGHANTIFPHISGAGLYSNPGSPTVSNCVFLKNKAHNGAGMFLWGGNPTVTNCIFAGNKFAGTGSGGGISSFSFTNLTVVNSLFVGNTGGIGRRHCHQVRHDGHHCQQHLQRQLRDLWWLYDDQG